ncbi:MAG: superoxide dismutase family protein [Proteobacteria bacterium]|nr:superoxide dismutase family protein [Pseudomonadota bacterium]
MSRILFLVFIAMAYAVSTPAAENAIEMYLVSDQGIGEKIGTITAADSQFGLILTPRLSNLPQGIHGFHVHQNPDCGHAMPGGKPMAALAAGGHYDPAKTDRHAGPYGNGHLGDLPALYVDKDGKASLPVLAPRLNVADLQGRSLMIHAGGDNYSDLPEKLGGGGGRIACGAVK